MPSISGFGGAALNLHVMQYSRPRKHKCFEGINTIVSFYLQPPTQPAPATPRVADWRLSKLNNHSALKNLFLGDVQPSRPGQWLEDWDVTSQSNEVYPVAAARSKASSPASRGSLSLPCLPRPVVIPSTPWWSRTARPQYFILFLHWHTSLLLQPFWVPVYTAPRRIALFKGFFAWPQYSTYMTSSPKTVWGPMLHSTLIT